MKKTLKTILPVAFCVGLAGQSVAQDIYPGHHPEVDSEHHLQFTAGEALQMANNELSIVLMGEVCRENFHFGVLGDHDMAAELGIILKEGESVVFVAPKLEILRLLGCKLFIRENIEFMHDALHLVPGATLEVPLQVGSTKAHWFGAGMVEKHDGGHKTLVLETGVTITLQ